MSFTATVIRVVIASPSDIPEARDAVEDALRSWNDAYALSKRTVLLPWRWETSSVSLLGDHPQALINSQGIDEADIVIALFGSRVGSPTPDAISGTVEEINRAVASGKPVHLYFSKGPLPNDVDTAQLDLLREFKAEISQQGLVGSFVNTSQLEHEVWKAMEHDIAALGIDSNDMSPESTARQAEIQVLPRSEREQKGMDQRGNVRYTTRRWFEISNVGNVTASQITFDSHADKGVIATIPPTAPISLAPGTSWDLPVQKSMGVTGAVLTVKWYEGDQEKSKTFDV